MHRDGIELILSFCRFLGLYRILNSRPDCRVRIKRKIICVKSCHIVIDLPAKL